jgi:hypothetical protein
VVDVWVFVAWPQTLGNGKNILLVLVCTLRFGVDLRKGKGARLCWGKKALTITNNSVILPGLSSGLLVASVATLSLRACRWDRSMSCLC